MEGLGAAQGLRVWPGPWQGQGWKVQIIGHPLAEVCRILKVNLIWRRRRRKKTIGHYEQLLP